MSLGVSSDFIVRRRRERRHFSARSTPACRRPCAPCSPSARRSASRPDLAAASSPTSENACRTATAPAPAPTTHKVHRIQRVHLRGLPWHDKNSGAEIFSRAPHAIIASS